MEKLSEAEIQKAILKWLIAHGYTHWRNYVGPILRGHSKRLSPNPMAGMPDVMGILKNRRGILFGCEVKTEKGKVSDKQIQWQERLTEAGGICFVSRSVEEFIQAMELAEDLDVPPFVL